LRASGWPAEEEANDCEKRTANISGARDMEKRSAKIKHSQICK
jgi:hypothetical protein